MEDGSRDDIEIRRDRRSRLEVDLRSTVTEITVVELRPLTAYRRPGGSRWLPRRFGTPTTVDVAALFRYGDVPGKAGLKRTFSPRRLSLLHRRTIAHPFIAYLLINHRCDQCINVREFAGLRRAKVDRLRMGVFPQL